MAKTYNEMTIEVASRIQSQMSERAHAGFDDMEPIVELFENYGYSPDDIKEVIDEGMVELAATFG